MSKFTIRAYNMQFLDDASEEFLEELLTTVAGLYSFEMQSSTLKTDRTCLNALRVVVSRLGSETGENTPPGMPYKIRLASAVAEGLSPPEEVGIDAEMERQLCRFVELSALWPGFLG